ncbi:MAG: hypothetical protein N3A38_14595, partial [Planctomycetota bacterium]|nr:hypothetical protein [Planctomycetota bacterium]
MASGDPTSPCARLKPSGLIGGLIRETATAPIPGAHWYAAGSPGAGILYRFAQGALAGAEYLHADMLLDGRHMAVFVLSLREGEGGPRFDLGFSVLNQCSARIRINLPEAVKLNMWRYE